MELLIVTAIFSVVVAATLSLAHKAQLSFRSERDFTETAEQARIAMDQIVRYLRQAGNDPTGNLKKSGVSAVVADSPAEIQINSDITGSAHATGEGRHDYGDPDGDNNDQMERVTVDYDGHALYIDIGDGNGRQEMADNISNFSMEYFDRNGNSHMPASADTARVVIRMTAETGRGDLRLKGSRRNRIALRSSVFLRNKALDIYEPPSGATGS